MTVIGVGPTADSAHWRVVIDGHVNYDANPGPLTAVHYIVDVDVSTGEAEIISQG